MLDGPETPFEKERPELPHLENRVLSTLSEEIICGVEILLTDCKGVANDRSVRALHRGTSIRRAFGKNVIAYLHCRAFKEFRRKLSAETSPHGVVVEILKNPETRTETTYSVSLALVIYNDPF